MFEQDKADQSHERQVAPDDYSFAQPEPAEENLVESNSDKKTAMAKAQDAVDPILRKPPPRQIVHRRGALGSFKGWFALLIPHVWVGIVLIYTSMMFLLLPYVGQDIPVTVTDLQERAPAKRHSDPQYQVTCSYQREGVTIKETSYVSSETFKSLKVGENQRIKIRTLSRFPSIGTPVFIIDGQPQQDAGFGFFIIPFALFWNTFMFVFIWFGLGIREQLRCRSLTKFGKAVAGRITGTEVVTGKSASYYVRYEFVGKGESAGKAVKSEQKGRMRITKEEYNRIKTGDSCNVLFNPQDVTQNLCYEFDQYRVVK